MVNAKPSKEPKSKVDVKSNKQHKVHPKVDAKPVKEKPKVEVKPDKEQSKIDIHKVDLCVKFTIS
jgi:hypothetical protein